MTEFVDLIVTPLREYGREVHKRTGRRVKLEVTIDAELFERLMAEIDRPYDLMQPSVVFLENVVQIVVASKPGPITHRDLDGKTLHSATLDASGRTLVTLLDDKERSDG